MSFSKAGICKVFPLLFILVVFLLGSVVDSSAQETTESVGRVTVAEVEDLKISLEDPEKRGALIRQLELLAQVQEPAQKKEIQSAAAEVLKGLSQRFESFSRGIMQLAAGINSLPAAGSWFAKQVNDPERFQFWKEVLTNVALIIVAGYLIYFLGGGVLRRLRKTLYAKQLESRWLATLHLFGIMLLELLPVVAFALVASLSIGFLSPRENTRLVVLAWVNAFVIVHIAAVIVRFFLAPDSDSLRFLPIGGETANYLEIWILRLLRIGIYGFFLLQAASLIGLPPASYDILLHLTGLLLTLLVIIIIIQNRLSVSDHLRQWSQSGEEHPAGLDRLARRLAGIWHFLAIGYAALFFLVWALDIHGGFPFFLKASALSLAACFIGWVVLRVIYTIFNRGISIEADVKERFPGLDARVNRYLLTLKKALRGLVLILVVLAISQAWGLNAFTWLASDTGRVFGGAVTRIAAILVVTFLVWEIVSLLIQNYLNSLTVDGVMVQGSARIKTLLAISRKVLLIVLVVFSSLMVLSELGLDIAPLLAGAGVLGLAVGFGAQKLVQDVITGVFILIEDQISEGDIINVGDKGGVVEGVSIRTVRLRDYSGTVHTIPYSAISTVSNLTKEFSFYVFQVGVAYRENVDEVMAVLKELSAQLQLDVEYGPKILEPLEVSGVDAFADSAVVIKARLKTVPTKQWWVGREFNRRMKNRFDELGIEIPFPHTTIYFGEDKQGQAPAATVKFDPENTGLLVRQASETP